MIEKLLVFFASAMDYRRIDPEHTPYLYSLSQRYPYSRINNFPEIDLDPTLFTGLYPHEHGMWQVRLKSEYDAYKNSVHDYIPDIVSTTKQCFIHLYSGSFNLASVPDWRRRRFEIMKTRYDNKILSEYLTINGSDTFFNIIGERDCSYTYSTNLYKLNQIVPNIFSKNLRYELIETHGLDTISHWYLDNKQRMTEAYNIVDRYIKYLHAECEKRGITLMILADHGMELVKKTVNIKQKILELDIKNSEITYYIEASKVRFWFHSDSAREKMLNYLSTNTQGMLFNRQDMSAYNINFEDDSSGEYYFVLNPGNIFFPNDFYHPIGNLFLGLTNKQSRSRLLNPAHRGYHGYLPNNDCEKGTLMLLHDAYKTDREEIETIDVAPTIVNLLGDKQPSSLKGRSAFHHS